MKEGNTIRLYEEIPELTGATAWVNGEKNKKDLIGQKLILVHFWSVSCRLCKEVMPKINQLRDDYAQELTVIAVHLPRSVEDYQINLVKENIERYQLTQSVYLDHDAHLTHAFGRDYVPAYYLFDRAGKLRYFHAGKGSIVMLEQRINRLLS